MKDQTSSKVPPFRIGHGYDVHRFGEGSFIVLGGVQIPHHSGLVAHSDGDVLIHAHRSRRYRYTLSGYRSVL